MERRIKNVVFDYGRTLFDRESNSFFPEVKSVLQHLSQDYALNIVSFSKPADIADRITAMKTHGIWQYFERICFVDNPENKHSALNSILISYNLNPTEIVIVDDYVIRSIAWANSRGAIAVWFCNGKFASVEPDENTGQPLFKISNFAELIGCIGSLEREGNPHWKNVAIAKKADIF